MGEPEIDIAIKAFEEIRVNTDHADAYHYNMAVGLLAMARALKEQQDWLEAAKIQLSRLESKVDELQQD
jgi:hypothetical protein